MEGQGVTERERRWEGHHPKVFRWLHAKIHVTLESFVLQNYPCFFHAEPPTLSTGLNRNITCSKN